MRRQVQGAVGEASGGQLTKQEPGHAQEVVWDFDGVKRSGEQVQALLEAENRMRRSAATQAKYTEAEESAETDWMLVTDASRRELLRAHGLPDSEASVRTLQRAALAYPHIPLYIKFNRCRQGELAALRSAHAKEVSATPRGTQRTPPPRPMPPQL